MLEPVVEEEIRVQPLTVEAIYDSARVWVDSVYVSLSDEERIAQLFWITLGFISENKAAYNKVPTRWNPVSEGQCP